MSQSLPTVEDQEVSLPNKYPFLDQLNLDLNVIDKLTIHLDRIKSGNDVSIRSPFAKSLDTSVILERWDEIFNSRSDLINTQLRELELSNRNKFGPRSIAKPWTERIDGVKSYFNDRSKSLPFKITRNFFTSSNLRPLSLSNASKYLKSSTQSGLPDYKRKALALPKTLRDFDEQLQACYPCVLFTRTQESGKTRDVWGYPIANTLYEQRYYQPLLEYQKKLNWRSALRGPESVDEYITKLINKASSDNSYLLSIDFSTYDASVSDELIDLAFHYITRLFVEAERGNIKEIRDTFNTIGLVTPSGIFRGRHGIPSGSTFTNEVGSIVQSIIAKSCGFNLNDSVQIQGDDGVYVGQESMIDSLITTFKESGLNVNLDKSHLSKDYCVYLQKLHHPDYVDKYGLISGIYPTYRALNRIIFQERWADFEDFGLDGIDYYSIRTISILENCRNHPLFEDLVSFVYSLDKYNLVFSKRAISKYLEFVNNSSGSGGFLANQYGDRIGGIWSFDTVRVLNKLRKA